LCAVILSAQCTDARVNLVVPNLWAKYPTPEKLAKPKSKTWKRSSGPRASTTTRPRTSSDAPRSYWRISAGVIPKDIEEFVKVPGVGRKTANVVLGEIYGVAQGIAVDTHVARLAFRLGLTKQKDPGGIEKDLMKAVPQKDWIPFSHRIIQHGRQVCDARKPLCSVCTLARWCPKQGLPQGIQTR
jgi:endonuclease-3